MPERFQTHLNLGLKLGREGTFGLWRRGPRLIFECLNKGRSQFCIFFDYLRESEVVQRAFLGPRTHSDYIMDEAEAGLRLGLLKNVEKCQIYHVKYTENWKRGPRKSFGHVLIMQSNTLMMLGHARSSALRSDSLKWAQNPKNA